MTKEEMKELVEEMNRARHAFQDAQWKIANAIVDSGVVELINAGIVKPCVPMSMVNSAADNQRRIIRK